MIVTSQVIESAYEQACIELAMMDSSYTIYEQSGEGYYDMQNGKYYYQVNTVYQTPAGGYGAFATLYELQ